MQKYIRFGISIDKKSTKGNKKMIFSMYQLNKICSIRNYSVENLFIDQKENPTS